MKRIIFTVTNDLNYDQRMQRICTSLQSNGFDVLLVGRQLKASNDLMPQLYQQRRLKCFFNKSALFYLEYNIRLLFFLLKSKVDIVSTVDLDTVLAAYIVHKWRSKSIVFDAHEYFTELPELKGKPLVKKIWTWIANYTLPNIKHAYTVNHSLSDIFTEKYGVEYGCIRSITKQRSIDPISNHGDQKIILYQGALNVGRGLETAIKTMQFIESCRLEIAGYGDLELDLKELVRKESLESKVVFLGRLSPEELALKTQEAYIGLNLLASDSLNYYYSLANKFFDYMHAGIPSINMNFPEYKHINQQYEVSILLEALEEETLKKAIQKLLTDKEYYNALQRNSQIAKKHFTWEQEEEKLIQIYKNI